MSVLEDAFYGAGWDEGKHPRAEDGRFRPILSIEVRPGNTAPVKVTARETDPGPEIGHLYLRPDGTVDHVRVEPEYRRRGIATQMVRAARNAGYEVKPSVDLTLDGRAFFKSLSAAGFDESKHPRYPEGTPVGSSGAGGGRFKSKMETEILPATVETTKQLYDQLLEAHNRGLWPVSRGEDAGDSHFGRPGMDLSKGVSSALSHAMAAIEGGSRDEMWLQGDYNEDEWVEGMDETPVFFIVVRNEDGLPIGVMDFAEDPNGNALYGGAAGATKGAGLPMFAAFVESAAARGKGASWSAGNKRAADLYDRLGIPRGGGGAYHLSPENATLLAKDLFALARSRTAAVEAMVAAGWAEADHPRHPGGTPVGGQFRTLYHVSPVSNREQIRKEGLLAEAPKRYTDSGPGVYTFGSRDEAWRFATTGERMHGYSDIWEVKNEGGLQLAPDPFFEPGHPMAERAVAQMGEKPSAFVTRGNIPPEALTLHPNPWHPDPATERRLTEEALQSWVGDPASMRIHMAAVINPDDATPYEDLSGSGKQMRDQAEALVNAVQNGNATTKKLYRGAKSIDPGDLGVPQSWTESKAVAKKFAGKDGQVFTLNPGEARGIRMADYISSGLDVREKQWLLDPWSFGVVSSAWAEVASGWDESEHPRWPKSDPGESWEPLEQITAAGWDESEHPRNPKGPGGGRFRSLQEVQEANPDADLWAHESSGGVKLDQIKVQPEKRGQGVASKALDDVLSYADSRGMPVALTIGHDPEDRGLTKKQKERWYRSRGFVPNRGRNKDFAFTEAWIRPAQVTAAGWDESKHPRDPGGDQGGQFVEKGTTAVAERPTMGLGREMDLANINGRSHLTPDEQAQAEARLREFLDQAGLSMRVPEDAMTEIFRDGEFMNQHQHAEESRGLQRVVDSEAAMLGLPNWETATAEDLPKYAYLGPDTEHTNMYGAIKVHFKDEVKDRATFTVGDSLMTNPLPSEIRNPRWQSAVSGNVGGDVTTIDWDEALLNGDLEYMEAQIYGKLTPDDIESVEILDEDYWEDEDPLTGMPLVGDVGQMGAVMDELTKRKIPWSTYTPEGDFSGEWA